MDRWTERAKNYNKIKWVTDKGYLKIIRDILQINKSDRILDAGCGTGKLILYLSKYCSYVYGIDSSFSMIKNLRLHFGHKIFLGDIRSMAFVSEIFNKVVARMVFHHIQDYEDFAYSECYRVLKPGGIFLVSERIHPSGKCEDFYKKVFKIKGETNFLSTESIFSKLIHAGFKNVKVHTHTIKRVSINNWINSTEIDLKKRAEIFRMYLYADANIIATYNMEFTSRDIFIDTPYTLVWGTK